MSNERVSDDVWLNSAAVNKAMGEWEILGDALHYAFGQVKKALETEGAAAADALLRTFWVENQDTLKQLREISAEAFAHFVALKDWFRQRIAELSALPPTPGDHRAA